MALQQYKKKRSFSQTPEPKGGQPGGQALRFVVQKHDASHLHYDFRLEMAGVLKSWAVPKGPSTDPSVKRLAMMVEDHPYDYRDFEGVIPEGNYGAGTVMVWDEGTYEPLGDERTKAAQQRALLKEVEEGNLKFTLHGKKLKGEFALVKTKGMGEHAWLLIKHRDRYASPEDITRKERSVLSRKTLAGIARGGAHRRPANARAAAAAPHRKKKAAGTASSHPSSKPKETTAHEDGPSASKKEAKGKKAPFPVSVTPMLATLVDGPFESPGWIYEVKWDGYRALAFRHGKKTELLSRNGKSFREKFYPVYDAVKAWDVDAVVDGEIVVVNERGVSDFGALQQWRSEADGELLYYVFDILWHAGKDLTALPLAVRREILEPLIPEADGAIRLSAQFDVPASRFLEAVKKAGLEGIMAKRTDSAYATGQRTRDWLKIKASRRQEVVIGGYTRNEDTDRLFSSLLVGVFKDGSFRYTGKVGTGFNRKTQQELMERFRPLAVKKPPFGEAPDVNQASRFRPHPPHADAVWLKPKLVCEVSFTELTRDGVMRHPSFQGMREDKEPGEVVLEREVPRGKVPGVRTAAPAREGAASREPAPAAKPASRKLPGTILNPSDETQVRRVNGHELRFTHLSKIFWPAEKLTKRDLINYYHRVASVMLPYLKDRPQSLNRFPNGISGAHFYQKDVTGKVPDWVDTFLYHTEDDDASKHFLVAKDEASLLYMASLGCIEIHPWSSTVRKPGHPTWCIIDLDPGKKNSFDQVIEAALATHEVLDELGIPGYPKTSGASGMHVYIPLGAKYTHEQSKEFARALVTLVHERLPGFTTLERTVSDRKGMMYLDFLQNRPQATIAAPYSLRPRPGATVSMPLDWKEVHPGLRPEDFTIFHAAERIASVGDLFKPVLGKGIDLKKVIQAFKNR